MADLKLTFTYDDALSCDVSQPIERDGVTYRVRAVRDDHAENPFEDSDGHWPMLVRVGGERESLGTYERQPNSGVAISTPFTGAGLSSCRTPDDLLVHDQHAFARIFGYTSIKAMLAAHGGITTGAYHRDADDLREAFQELYGDIENTTDRWAALEAIYGVLGVPVLNTTVTGYSQGDWADLLIVGVPEKEREFQGETVRSPDAILADLQAQADLYDAWAFGDCYGFVIEQRLPLDDDEDAADWDEIDSCWGYYGTDHDASGLADAALDALPRVPVVA